MLISQLIKLILVFSVCTVSVCAFAEDVSSATAHTDSVNYKVDPSALKHSTAEQKSDFRIEYIDPAIDTVLNLPEAVLEAEEESWTQDNIVRKIAVELVQLPLKIADVVYTGVTTVYGVSQCSDMTCVGTETVSGALGVIPFGRAFGGVTGEIAGEVAEEVVEESISIASKAVRNSGEAAVGSLNNAVSTELTHKKLPSQEETTRNEQINKLGDELSQRGDEVDIAKIFPKGTEFPKESATTTVLAQNTAVLDAGGQCIQ